MALPRDTPAPHSLAQPGRALAVVLLSIAAFALYTLRIEAKGIWWDESLSLHRARGDVAHILSNRIEHPGTITIDLHPPLYFLFLRGVTQLAGESDLALRFASAALATCTVPMLYALGARLVGRRVGLLAAALGAASPFLLWYAQEARMYTMVTFLSAASLYALWRAMRDRRRAWGAAYVLLTLLGLATQYLFALLIAAQLLLVPLLRLPTATRRRRDAGAPRDVPRTRPSPGVWAVVFVVLAGGALVVALAAGLFAQRHAGRTYVPLGEMVADTLHVFALGATVPRPPAWPLDGAFLAAFLLGVAVLWVRPPRPADTPRSARSGAARWSGPATLLAPILVPLVGMWAYSRLASPLYMGSRYIIMGAPAFYLGAGVGLDAVWRRRRSVGVAALVVLLGAMAVSDYRYFYDPAYAAKEDHRAAARLIAEEGRPGDAIVITAPENVDAFGHYYVGELPIYPVPGVALTGASDAERIDADLRAVLAGRYERLWFVQSRTMFSDPEDLVIRWLDDNLLLLGRRSYPSVGSPVVMSTYLTAPPVLPRLPVDSPLGSFSGRLTLQRPQVRYLAPDGTERTEDLRAVREDEGDALGPLGPGQTVAVTLHWTSGEPLVGYKTSLRLVDPLGHVWVQSDEALAPYLDERTWPVGRTLRQGQGLRIPAGMPPAAYALCLVVYEADSGAALTWAAADGSEQAHADLGQLQVGRQERAPAARAVLPEHLSAALLPPRWGELELLAWEAAPATVGDRLYVNLYWRARRAPSEAYELVFNWRDEEGRIWHTDHRGPAGADYPTLAWRSGEVVWASLALEVPPDALPGRHTVHLLLYAPEQQRFLWLFRGPLPWAGRNLLIGAVTVE